MRVVGMPTTLDSSYEDIDGNSSESGHEILQRGAWPDREGIQR